MKPNDAINRKLDKLVDRAEELFGHNVWIDKARFPNKGTLYRVKMLQNAHGIDPRRTCQHLGLEIPLSFRNNHYQDISNNQEKTKELLGEL